MENIIGKNIGRYLIDEQIGQDSLSQIFRAHDQQLNRDVTVKILNPQRRYSNEFLREFERNVKIIAQLSHSNIVKILDFGEFEGLPFIVTEYSSGTTLSEQLNVPVKWVKAFKSMMPIADALGFAHKYGIIHRNINPSYIYINEVGDYSIGDFGIAQLMELEETKEMTGTVVGIGTPEYMSPEQGKGIKIDPRTDIYSFGIILYEMITGHKPFEGSSPMEVVIKQVTLQPISPKVYTPDLPENVTQIILKCLAKEPSSRYLTMKELMTDMDRELQSYLSNSISGNKKTRSLIQSIGIVAFVLILIGAGIWWSSFSEKINQRSLTETVAEILTTTPMNIQSPELEETLQPQTEITHDFSNEDILQTPEPIKPINRPAIEGETITTIYQPITLENLNEISEVARYGDPIPSQIIWSPDMSQILVGTSGGVLFVNTENYSLINLLDVEGWVTSLDITSDGNMVFVGTIKGEIGLWEITSGKVIFQTSAHSKSILSVKVSSNGQWAIAGSEDKTASIWDLTTQQELFRIDVHSLPIRSVGFAEKRRLAITASSDFLVNIWSLADGENVKTLKATSSVNNCVVSSDETILACGLNDGSIMIWDIIEYKLVRVLKDPKLVDPILSVDFSPNSSIIAVGGQDGVTRIWNILSGEKLYEFGHFSDTLIPQYPIQDLQFSPSGEKLVLLQNNGVIKEWIVGTTEGFWEKTSLGSSSLVKVSISPNGHYVALYWSNNILDIWDLNKAREILSVECLVVRGDTFSPSSTQFACLDSEKEIVVYEVLTGKVITRLIGYPAFGAIDFLPDGKILAATATSKIILWSLSTGAELTFPDTSFKDRCQVVKTLNGKFLAAGSENGLFVNESGINRLCSVQRSVRALGEAFLDDGSMIVFGLDNNLIEYWYLEGDYKKKMLSGHTQKVNDIAMTKDGKLMASCSTDGLIILWDTETGDAVKILDHHNGGVNSVVFSDDDKMLLSVSSDGTLQIWATQRR